MQRGRCGEKKKPSERMRRRWPDSFRRLARELFDTGSSANRDEISTQAESGRRMSRSGTPDVAAPWRHSDSVSRSADSLLAAPVSLGQLLPDAHPGSKASRINGSRTNFNLRAERAEALFIRRTKRRWAVLAQADSETACTIYRELRTIDTQTAERQWKTVETARRHVREGEGALRGRRVF